MPRKRTIVYVDGFNLYYNCLKYTDYKWLNLRLLFERVLPQNEIVTIKYYTAPISALVGTSSPQRQQAYLSALSSVENLKIIKGNFLVSEKFAPIIFGDDGNPDFRPESLECEISPRPVVVKIQKCEEKGSDVNIASHMVMDGYSRQFEAAVLVSNDTDFVEPLRILREELNLTVGLVSTTNKPHGSLTQYAQFIKHIRPSDFKAAQFPAKVPLINGGLVQKPAEW